MKSAGPVEGGPGRRFSLPVRQSAGLLRARPRLLRQRARAVDARAGLPEQVVDLAGQEEHGDDQENCDRRDDQAVLDEALPLLPVAKGIQSSLNAHLGAKQDVTHFRGTSLSGTWRRSTPFDSCS